MTEFDGEHSVQDGER